MAKLPVDRLRAVYRRFLDDATERLALSGWSPLEEPEPRRPVLVGPRLTLVRPLGDGFLGVLELTGHGAVIAPDGSVVQRMRHEHRKTSWGDYELLQVVPEASIEFEPATTVLRLIDDDDRARAAVDLEAFLAPGRVPTIEVPSEADVRAAVDNLVGLVESVVLPALVSSASTEVLLEIWGQEPPDGRSNGWLVPVSLAALQRFDEARAALDRWVVSVGGIGPDWCVRRSIRQLNRYLDAGGDLAEPPPRPPVPEPTRPSFSEHYRRMKGRREAIEAVRREAAGLERSERRRRLLEELSTRRIVESPRSIAHMLEDLEEWRAPSSWLDRQARSVRAYATLVERVGGLVGDVKRAVASDGVELPVWLEPPGRASYPAVSSSSARHGWWSAARVNEDEWVEVHLAPGATEVLGRALADAPLRVTDSAPLPAWLEEDRTDVAGAATDATEQPGEPLGLAVHLGADRVGHLDGDAARRFGGAMERAMHFDELPWVIARVTRLRAEGSFLLELAAPPGSSMGDEPEARTRSGGRGQVEL